MTDSAPPVVFVGVATLDALALVDHFPGRDERQVADEVLYAGGGPAATAAVAAARLGLEGVAFVGAVGDDAEGEQVLAGLVAEGVDVSGVRREAGRRTGASVVVVDRSTSSRAICTRPVPPLHLPDGSRSAELVRAARWVHVDHLGWGAVTQLLDPRSAARPRLSVDGGNPIDGYHPAGVDLDVPTSAALARRYGDRGIDGLLSAALAEGARCVVATLGADGAVAATADGRRLRAGVPGVDVVSTLGAGDVFHGALLAAVAREEPLERALPYATAVAALSCRGLDGRSRIPDHAEASAAAAAIDPIDAALDHA
jgi:sulfofructose kinase